MKRIHITTEDVSRCYLVKTILEKEYATHHTIHLLARQVGTNENKLKVSFKLVYKKTIHSFVTSIRIEKAKELLERTDLPVKTIAYKLGLDHSNLTKQFKQLTGFTPRQWRYNKTDIDKICTV
jgi:AraC-like DNA-binding protein